MIGPFRILKPSSVAEACSFLRDYGDNAKLYAGGTELLLVMKKGIGHWDYLIDVKQIPELSRIERDGGRHLLIGATVTHRDLERSPMVMEHVPLLADMEHKIANVRVRNVGTIGGNLCFGEPHSDPAVVLLVQDAEIILQSKDTERVVPLEKFFLAPYEVSCNPDEVVTKIRVPVLPQGMKGAHMRLATVERPTVAAAVAVRVKEEVLHEVRIAVGCVPPVPMRLRAVEELLQHQEVHIALRRVQESVSLIDRALSPISDIHGSAEFKGYMVRLLIGRALQAAVQAAADTRDA